MRRCLRCLLVGMLTFSPVIDGATACGRRAWVNHRCAPRVVMPAPMTMTHGGMQWGASDCGCEWPGSAWAGADSCGVSTIWFCEEIPCGVAIVGESWGAAVSAQHVIGQEVIVAEHPIMTESVVIEGDVATPAAPAERSPEPLAAIPDLEPVEPASATEPTGSDEAPVPAEAEREDAADAGEMADEQRDAAPAPEAPAPLDEPAPRRNVFEEAEETGDEDLQVPDGPAATEEPAVEPPFTIDPVPAESADAEPAPESAVDDDAPTAEGTGIDPDSADQGRAEPLRRWIDDTASFAVVGRLLDVRDDAVEIRRADGRDVLVPLDRLSGFDRGYVAEARERIAAARSPLPDPLATAGR